MLTDDFCLGRQPDAGRSRAAGRTAPSSPFATAPNWPPCCANWTASAGSPSLCVHSSTSSPTACTPSPGCWSSGDPRMRCGYLTEIRGTAAEFDNTYCAPRSRPPQIVGLLLGKAAEASERGIQLEISPETWLSESPEQGAGHSRRSSATSSTTPWRRCRQFRRRGEVVLEIVEDDDMITVVVTDNGPGVPAALVPQIFLDGYTTKSGAGGRLRGLGSRAGPPHGHPLARLHRRHDRGRRCGSPVLGDHPERAAAAHRSCPRE